MSKETKARSSLERSLSAAPAPQAFDVHPLHRFPDRLAARAAEQQKSHRLVWLRLSQSMFAGPTSPTRSPTVCGTPAPLRQRAQRLRPDL